MINNDEKLNNIIRLFSFGMVVSIATIVFAMIVVRGKCINKGYELSLLVDEIKNRRISLEKVETERSELLSKEKLFQAADRRGFIMMQEGKTFNVQR